MAKQLNCSSGNYQCGGRCLPESQKCNGEKASSQEEQDFVQLLTETIGGAKEAPAESEPPVSDEAPQEREQPAKATKKPESKTEKAKARKAKQEKRKAEKAKAELDKANKAAAKDIMNMFTSLIDPVNALGLDKLK